MGRYLSIITLNVNRLNAPTKRQRLAEWIKKIRPLYMLSARDPPQNKGHIKTKSEGLEKKILHAIGDQKKAGVAILISDKIDFKIKHVKRDKGGHYISAHGTFSRIDHILGHKSSLGKLKKKVPYVPSHDAEFKF